MPVASHVGRVLGHNDEVADAGHDAAAASRAQIPFASLVGLDRVDHEWTIRCRHGPPNIAQMTTATVMTMNTATMTTSVVVFSCCRNGLKPTKTRLGRMPRRHGVPGAVADRPSRICACKVTP
jgi:hypothetical protein